MNKVELIGRFTAAPELKVTQNGVSNTKFCIAVTRNYKNPQGGYDSDFLNCVAFKNQAEFICQYFGKGSLIGIVGNIQTRTWDGVDGKRKYSTEIIVEDVTFCEKRQNAQPQVSQPQYNSASMYTPDSNEFSDDDLPF